MSDYNEMFDKNYSIDKFEGFFGDVNDRIKKNMTIVRHCAWNSVTQRQST